MENFTHAGGVVVKEDSDGPKYLLIRAISDATIWVFPKGHIESGENPCDTAVREIGEEAAISAKPVREIGVSSFRYNNEDIHTQFYLCLFVGELNHLAEREIRWCRYEEALRLLPFEELREILTLVHKTPSVKESKTKALR